MIHIRISKYFYVDSLVVLIVFAAYCIGKLPHLMILYGAVMLHETAHFVACVILGEKVGELRFKAYGVNLCTQYIRSPLHAMIISASGPVASGFLILISGTFSSYWMHIFKVANIGILVLNIFPALPLDGGVFVKNLLSYNYGYIRSYKLALEITRIGAVVMGIFGIIFLMLSKYNISLLVISGFLLYNLREERKKLIFIRQMIYTKDFDRSGKRLRVKHMAVMKNVRATSLTDSFGYNYICHFFVYDNQMQLIGTLTQSEVIDGIIELGADAVAENIIDISGGYNEYERESVRDSAYGGKAHPIYRQ